MSKKENSNKEINQEKPNTKKYIVLVLILICILAAIGASVYIIKENSKEYVVEEVTEFSYFTLYKNQKYGVIDKQGNVIINPEYDKISIPNPSKSVFICYYNYNSENETYETVVYNEKKEELFKNYEEVLPLMFKDYTTKIPYEKKVLQYKENGKYGLIDFNGKRITKPEYDSIESLLYKEGYLLVEKEGKHGIIDGNGRKIVNFEYDIIIADGYYEKKSKYAGAGFIVGNKNEKGYQYGYINNEGKIILDVEYNEIDRITNIIDDKNVYLVAFKNGKAGILKNKEYIAEHQYDDVEYNIKNKLFLVKKLSKQGVITLKGEKVIDTEYDNILISGDKIIAQKEEENFTFDLEGNIKEEENEIISTDNENYFVTIDDNEKYGVINKNNEILINNKYRYIEYLFDDYFIASAQDGKVGVINSLDEIKIEFKYDVIQRIENSNSLQAILVKEKKSDFYNKNIENVFSMENATIYSEQNYIKIVSDNDIKYIDNEGKILSNKDILNNTLFAYKQDGKWGFIDIEGQIKVKTEYDMVTEFNEYGFAGIKKDDKWGVINSDGKVILEPAYTIDWQDPEFIGVYCRVNFGYGLDYYTDDLIK